MNPSCYTPVGLLRYFFHQAPPECYSILNIVPGPTETTVLHYLGVFLLTCVLESPFYFFLFRRERILKRFFRIACLNAITHPIVYFAFPLLGRWDWNYGEMLLAAEMFAPAVEGIVASFWAPPRWAMPVALIANLFSWGLVFTFSNGRQLKEARRFSSSCQRA